MSSSPYAASQPSTPRQPSTRRRTRRWVALAVIGVFLIIVMRQVLDPFGDAPYLEVPHGNHVHYVPQDRDPDVPLDNFPTRPAGPNERILPDGRIVPVTGEGSRP